MRITVTVDVAPEEVPMATELLAVLRQLTDHVNVRTTDGVTGPAATLAPPAAPAAAHPADRGPGTAFAAAAAAPPTPANSVPPAVNGAIAAPTAAPALAIPFPPGTPPQQQIAALIAQSEYAAHPEPLGQQLEALLRDPSLGGLEALMPEFVQIWTSMAVNTNLIREERSAVPFVMLLAGMSQEVRNKFRDAIMRDLLKHLTIPRPASADRGEYFVHAEVFGAMVSIEALPIDGAVQTMCTLARNPQKRGAAITMLGKTVELAHQLIVTKVPTNLLASMRQTVSEITEPEFVYDVQYINEQMGWGPGGAAAAR